MRKLFFLGSILSFLLLAACNNKPAGEKAATSDAAPAMKAGGDKQYAVNANTSKVMWEGAQPAKKHSGTINVSSGTISVENGAIKSGTINIDMTSLTNMDLEAGKGKEKLEGHLKSADFFDVGQFPNAKFELTKVKDLEGDAEANRLIYGNLTIKGITKEVGFKAKVDMLPSGVTITSPSFTIDRTDWNVQYGSNKFFDDLKDKAINDAIGLKIDLKAA